MGIFDFFSKDKKKDEGPDPLHELTLSNLKVGYFLDYDMKTYEVTAYNTYDWGEGDITEEWQLKCGDEVLYLEKEEDDEVYWSLSKKLAIGKLGSGILDQIKEEGDPPDEIVFSGKTFYLEESGAGHFLKDGKGVGVPMLSWGFEDDDGEVYLGIEQWGEDDFEASEGKPVYEYQFTNILPRAS